MPWGPPTWCALLACTLAACAASEGPASRDVADTNGTPEVVARRGWQLAFSDDAALLGIWSGPAAARPGELWVVGADLGDGQGPVVWRGTSERWTRIALGAADPVGGHLWAVAGSGASGPIWLAGAGGRLFRAKRIGTENVLIDAVATGTEATLFGLRATSSDEAWAVGGYIYPQSGPPVLLHIKGDLVLSETLPSDPAQPLPDAPLLAIAGPSPQDLWAVGEAGLAFHWDGQTWARATIGDATRLAGIAVQPSLIVAAGGSRQAALYERTQAPDGIATSTEFIDKTSEAAAILNAVYIDADQRGIAVGMGGVAWAREDAVWRPLPAVPRVLDLSGVTGDSRGDWWVVGGDLLGGGRLRDGALYRYGPARDDLPIAGRGLPATSAATPDVTTASTAADATSDASPTGDSHPTGATAATDTGPDAPADTWTWPAGLRIGTLTADGAAVTPFVAGQRVPIQHGPQGGFHVAMAVALDGPLTATWTGATHVVPLALGLELDGVRVATFETRGYPFEHRAVGLYLTFDVPVAFDTEGRAPYANAAAYAGKTVLLTARLELASGPLNLALPLVLGDP